MNELREIRNKSSIFFIGKVFGQLFASIIVIIYAKVFGPEVYGQYIFLLSFFSIIYILPSLGMNNGIVAFLSRKSLLENEKKSLLSYGLLLTTIFSFICIIILLFLKEPIYIHALNSKVNVRLILLMLPTIFLMSIKVFLAGVMKGLKDIKTLTVVEHILGPLIKIILIVIVGFLFKIKSIEAIILIYYFELVLVNLVYVVKLYKLDLLGGIIKTFDNKQILLYSYPMLFLGLLTTLNQSIDKYMIAYNLTGLDVTIYKIATQIGKLSNIAMVSLNSIFAPVIASLYDSNEIEKLHQVYAKTTKWLFATNIMFFGYFLSFSDNIMELFGSEYFGGGIVLVVISLSQVIYSFVGSAANINAMTGKSKMNFYAGVISLIFNIVLNYLLIPKYGVLGAAISTGVAIALTNTLNFIFVYKYLKIHPFSFAHVKILFVALLSSGLAFAFSKILDIGLFMSLLICGCIYLFIFFYLLIKIVLNSDEINLLRKMNKPIIKKILDVVK